MSGALGAEGRRFESCRPDAETERLTLICRSLFYLWIYVKLYVIIINGQFLKEKNDNAQTKYIELVIKKRNLIFCKEFDSYNI